MEPVKRDMELLSNSMATYAHLRANPESFALCFLLGVGAGLLVALGLLVLSITCRPKRRAPPPPERRRLKESSEEEEDEEEEEEEGGEDEELQRRLEERERIVREIWKSGQPASG
ncbi:eva-1 homolog Bb [Menidia menidia]